MENKIMANSLPINGVFAGAELLTSDASSGIVVANATTNYLVIPLSSVHSLTIGGTNGYADLATAAASGDEDLCFGLVDVVAGYIGSGKTYIRATESDRILNNTTLRKDYTMSVDLEWDSNTATAAMNVKQVTP